MTMASAYAAARRRPAAYALAAVPVALVTLLKLRVDWIGRDAPVAIYLGAVMFVAWLGGTGPGLLATLLSSLAGMYFFVAPYGSLAVTSGDEAARIAIAAIEGTFISLLAGALRRTSDDLARQVRERTRAEVALRVANEEAIHLHKMRAIGEFAGGVAHDFNNMLTIVRTCVALLERRLPDDHPGRAEVEEIRAATERAVALARQLLTFARRRESERDLVHLHEILVRIRPIVSRLVGPGIGLELALGATRDLVLGDVGQLEQAIVNLAANGRDAMPDGGTLTIATSDAAATGGDGAAPRAGIELAVGDSGIGMDEETRRRAFDPFFTTKPVGSGTGLGLSMVFGIVEASGGTIAVESAPGKGTTFRVVLPVEERERGGPGAGEIAER